MTQTIQTTTLRRIYRITILSIGLGLPIIASAAADGSVVTMTGTIRNPPCNVSHTGSGFNVDLGGMSTGEVQAGNVQVPWTYHITCNTENIGNSVQISYNGATIPVHQGGNGFVVTGDNSTVMGIALQDTQANALPLNLPIDTVYTGTSQEVTILFRPIATAVNAAVVNGEFTSTMTIMVNQA